MNLAVGNPEIPRIRCVEHLHADLEILAAADSRVLDQREVDVSDAISSKQVARGIADALAAGTSRSACHRADGTDLPDLPRRLRQ